MHPKLFELPWLGWPINSYGFMIMIGFLLATYIGVRRGRLLGYKSDFILDVGIISMIFGIIGAKVNYIVQYHETSAGLRIFDFGDGGMRWWGAVLLGPIPFLAWYWRTKDERQVKLYTWQNGVLLVLTLFFALIGTRLAHVMPDFFLRPKEARVYDWSIIENWQSGFVLYGGLIAAVLAGALYTKMRGHSIAKVADLSAPLVMIGLAFGRVGCFLNGCCYGKIWDGFCAVRFPPQSVPYQDQLNEGKIDYSAATSQPVVPTQLFEAGMALVLFGLLTWYDRRKKKNAGETMLVMVMGYAVWRFIVEFMRADLRPNLLGSLSYSQSISLLAFIGAAIWYYFVRSKPAPLPALASEAAAMPPGKPTKTGEPAK